eukprot:352115-Chlamydomonas_euryale.AAC.4
MPVLSAARPREKSPCPVGEVSVVAPEAGFSSRRWDEVRRRQPATFPTRAGRPDSGYSARLHAVRFLEKC